MNPKLLAMMEKRHEILESELTELRNLYASPTSSLNLVLDGLLKKIKDLEASRPSLVVDGGRLGSGAPHRMSEMLPSTKPPGSVRSNGNDSISYLKLT